ncbi:MAG TPA: glutathione S-transferase C-terminal domain-containing protein [Streptosporangiaceae bacterium]|nr:glutathione S-transferase C-terminal domain-containing protein [Streptosporangiaceae bacterium]
MRKLKGLEDVVSLSNVDDQRDGRGWAFRERRGADPVNGFTLLAQAYEATEPGYAGHVSVPALWDRQTGKLVSNNFPDITIDFDTQFGAFARTSLDLYPPELRGDIDALNERVYETVNNGTYRVAGATTEPEYQELRQKLTGTLDALDERLAGQRYLFGAAVTEADVRLWPTLARSSPRSRGSARGPSPASSTARRGASTSTPTLPTGTSRTVGSTWLVRRHDWYPPSSACRQIGGPQI